MPIPCIICGSQLKIDKELERICHFCGKKEVNDFICPNGHYVCGRCHIDKRPKDEYGLPK